MDKFLLGFIVGSFATVSYLKGQQARRQGGSTVADALTVGRVDELSSASVNAEASALNAGDGTPPARPVPQGADTPLADLRP